MRYIKYINLLVFCCAVMVLPAQQNISDLRLLLNDPLAPVAGQNTLLLSGSEMDWKFSEYGKNDWKKATVPGCVHTDITNAEELYYGDNEKKYAWIEEKDWEYTLSFRLPNGLKKEGYNDFRLVFEQLDVYASVYLNGRLVLQTANAFCKWETDITALVNDTSLQVLRVVFESPVKKAKALQQKYPYTFPGGERIFTRKAQFEYGWDFGPRFVTSGIRKPVYLVARKPSTIVINDVRLTEKELNAAEAEMEAQLGIYSGADAEVYVACPGIVLKNNARIKLKKGNNTVKVPFVIRDPQKWWPRGYGQSVVYPLTFSLYDRKNRKNKKTALSEKNIVHAFCDIQLVQEPDRYGKSFFFRVNGQPVFAKGVNMIPYDVFTENWNDQQLKQLYDLNANMVRVWGGGYYPSDAFYLYCLANGILVWQDIMYACAMYPYKDENTVLNVQHETREQFLRLQKFPNIALWCGNNESSEGWHNWGWQKELKYSPADSADIWKQYADAFFTDIPGILNQHTDSSPAYVSTSPRHGWGRDSSLVAGDCHYWGVWWGKQPIDTFNHRIPRFMSEYGMQSMPSAHYLLRYAPLTGSNMDRSALSGHQKHPSGFGNLDFYLDRYYKVPANIFHYVYASQLLQAYAMQTAVEAHRRNREKCMGTLVWQMNDCWPGITWSLVDHALQRKIAFETVKKSFETFLVSVEKNQDGINVFIVSDTTQAVPDTLSFTLYDQAGKMLKQWQQPVSIEPGRSKVYLQVPATETAPYFMSSVYAVSKLHNINRSFHHDFVLPNEKLLEDPLLKAEIVRVNDPCSDNCMYEFRLTAEKYCPSVAYFPKDPDRGLIYRSFIDPAHPLVIPFTDYDYNYYRELSVKPADKFMYLYKLMRQ